MTKTQIELSQDQYNEADPNEETLKAIAELNNYKNMKSYSLEEFLKKIVS